jgi:hypothetical protein
MEKRIRFVYGEKIAFDRHFPPDEIKAYINKDRDNPVEIFTALNSFNFPEVKPEAKGLVIAYLSQSMYAPQVNMHDGENGQVMIYRQNIEPLLRAAIDIFGQVVNLFTDNYVKTFDKIISFETE